MFGYGIRCFDFDFHAMAKVLLVTNTVPHYRLPLYKRLGRLYDLTVLHGGQLDSVDGFSQARGIVTRTGPFYYLRSGIDFNRFDVVVFYANLRFLNLYKLLFFSPKRRFKVVLYGIGVAASYNTNYDSSLLYSFVMRSLLAKADAAIFYDNYPVIKYCGMGIDPKKLFAAFNTVDGNRGNITSRGERTSILFVGSLYTQKGINILLEAYKLNVQQGLKMPELDIIGDGPDRANIERWLTENNLTSLVTLHGSVVDESEIAGYFNKAIVCVSPGQAGLSVQKAFSYGVPFLTSLYPISGGEFSCLMDGITGFYYDGSVKGLASKMIDILQRMDLDHIYTNCRIYYERFRSPEVWVEGFSKALNHALKGQRADEGSSN